VKKLFVLTFSAALAIAAPLYAQTSGHTPGTSGSMGAAGPPSSSGGATGASTSGTAGRTSATADRTPTPDSISGGRMQGSGVNASAGAGSNASETMDATGSGTRR
jgi:hypothetical protein